MPEEDRSGLVQLGDWTGRGGIYEGMKVCLFSDLSHWQSTNTMTSMRVLLSTLPMLTRMRTLKLKLLLRPKPKLEPSIKPENMAGDKTGDKTSGLRRAAGGPLHMREQSGHDHPGGAAGKLGEHLSY